MIAEWNIEGDARSANLIASYGEGGNWRGRYWHTYPGKIEGSKSVASFPASHLPCFISGTVIDSDGLQTSTPLLQVNPTPSESSTLVVPDYDGCREWGGFESDHVEFLKQHQQQGQVRWQPKLSTDAKHGMSSAILESDQTILPPILSTAGIAHRFSCFLKSKQPATVRVLVAGQAQDFSVGTEWSEVSLEVTPLNAVMGGIVASIKATSTDQILVDEIQFRPIPTKSN